MTYIRNILELFNMSMVKLIDIFVNKGYGLSMKYCPNTLINKAKMVVIPYASTIDSLMYAIIILDLILLLQPTY